MMAMAARGVLKLNADPLFSQALYQLDSFSHIWLIFSFHQSLGKPWRPRIEPPRTDGPNTVGVFASRSPHRPNPIGMSVVKLEKIDFLAKDGIEIHVSGVDLLDGTPVLDIKPYLPYADIISEANAGWASREITRYPVRFSPMSLAIFDQEGPAELNLKQLIEEVLSLDPRPRSQREAMPIEDPSSDGKIFRFRIHRFDVEWQVREGKILVLRLLP